MAQVAMTNKEWGDRVGVQHSMASRIRAGKRLPGPDTITRISEAFGIPLKTLMEARKKGAPAFGELIRKREPKVESKAPAAPKAAKSTKKATKATRGAKKTAKAA